MNLDSLIQQMNAGTEWPTRSARDTQGMLSTAVDAPEYYVVPTIKVMEGDLRSPILIIEAAGAVGKSLAAQYISNRLKWPLVHADKAQVGTYTLTGLIHDAFTTESDYFSLLAAGKQGLVIDALDEAHLRAGTENLLAFTDNAASLGEGRLDGVGVIILSRIDTADFLKLRLSESRVEHCVARLDFFSSEGAVNYITQYHARRAHQTSDISYRAAMANPLPFKKLVARRFQVLASTLLQCENVDYLNRWDDIRDFLGYAPVLTALAESVATPNPASEISRLRDVRYQDETPLLLDIATSITEREQGKVLGSLSQKLTAMAPIDASTDFRSSLYSHAEQIARLADYASGGDGLEAPVPASLPDSLREEYETAIRQFLPDHPFLRGRKFAGPVFSDVVVASLDASVGVAAIASPRVHPIDPGPFYRRFVKVLSGGAIEERIIDSLLWSWGQESELYDGKHNAAMLFAEGDRLRIDFVVPSVGGASDGGSEATVDSYVVGDFSGVLSLAHIPRATSITGLHGFVLNELSGRANLPAGVVVVANEIEIVGEILQVDAYKSMALLYGIEIIQADRLRSVQGGTNGLKIMTPLPPPLLRGFGLRIPQGDSSWLPERAVLEDFVNLRAILLKFYSTVHMGLSCSVERMEQDVIRSSDGRRRILELLEGDGVIGQDNGWWRMERNALPFSISDVKNGNPSSEVLGYILRIRNAD